MNSEVESGWVVFDNGRSIGQRGSEEGTILRDEEHQDGARITLEQGGVTAPFSITCGVYGWMAHTTWFADRESADRAFDEMKVELAAILGSIPFESDLEVAKRDLVSDSLGKFVERFR